MTASRAAWLVAICLLPAPVLAAGPTVSKMSPEDFERLGLDATIQVSGRSMTKREFLSAMDRVKAQAAGNTAKMTEESLNAELSRATQARVTADNDRVKAQAAGAKPEVTDCDTPRITSIVYTAPLEPGEQMLIKGCGFQRRGQYHEAPRVMLLLAEGVKQLAIVGEVGPWQLQVEARTGYTGVGDQQTSLVVDAFGNRSNSVPVQFRAAREIKILLHDEVSVHLQGEHPEDNKCSQNFDTLRCEHWGWVGIGTDKISASLKNGWTFKSASLYQTEPNIPPRKNRFAALGGLQPGSTSANLEVLWIFALQHGDIGVRYELKLAAEGIRGTSYK